MSICKYCGSEIEFMQNWRGKWYVCDRRPPEWRQESYMEPTLGVFISVFIHVCEEDRNEEHISVKQKRRER